MSIDKRKDPYVDRSFLIKNVGSTRLATSLEIPLDTLPNINNIALLILLSRDLWLSPNSL